MRRKHMMVALFLGALTLGACVEDGESPAVEAIRDAKTEQLTSLANLQAAEAEAATKKAAADAALLAAQADAAKVQSELDGVALQRKQVAVESARVTLELEKAMTDVTKEKLQIELQQQLTELEKQKVNLDSETAELENTKQLIADRLVKDAKQLEFDLLNSQWKVEDYANQLIALQETKADDEKKRVIILIKAYQMAAEKLNIAKIGMNGIENKLISAQNELKTTEETKAQSIEGWKQGITAYEKQIAAIENVLITDYADLKKAYEEAVAQTKVLNLEWQEAKNIFNNTPFQSISVIKENLYYNKVEKYRYAGINIGGEWKKLMTRTDIKENVSVENYSSTYLKWGYYVVNTDAFSLSIANKENLVSVAKTLMDGGQKNYDDAVKATVAAKKAWDEAAAADKETTKNAYEQALSQQTIVENLLKNSTNNYESQKTALADVKADLAYLTNATEAAVLNKLIDEYNVAGKQLIVNSLTESMARYAFSAASSADQTLKNRLDNENDADTKTLIAQLKKNIADNEMLIADMTGVTSQKEVIAVLEAEKAEAQLNLDALQVIYNGAKADMEAAINK